MIANEEVRSNPYSTSIASVDAVVRAPYGSHPFASPGHYLEDAAHIREYVAAATPLIKDGKREAAFDAYLARTSFDAEIARRVSRPGSASERILSLHEFYIDGHRLHQQGADGGVRRQRDR